MVSRHRGLEIVSKTAKFEQVAVAKKFATLRHRRFSIFGSMYNESDNLRELLWRRKLSDLERVELRGRPDLEIEARLTEMLANVSDAPVPSNFTARVLDAIELEEKKLAPPRNGFWNWRLLFPRIAVAAAILIFAGVSLQRYEANSQRVALARNMVQLAAAQPPSVDVLVNLDAIQRMSLSGHADNDLLAALQ